MPAIRPPEWVCVTAPKRGNREDENEDAARGTADGLRFVVSDGASEGWESRPWAARLAEAFLARPPGPTDFAEWLRGIRASWAAPEPAGPVPWYASVKQEQGSFATLAGLELRRSQNPAGWAWRAVAIGDSCLFHVRGDEVRAAFPIDTPAGFGNRPVLVPSTGPACPEPEWLAGRAEPGDLFLLATDAVAARLLDPAARDVGLAAARAALAARAPDLVLSWFRAIQDAHNDDVSLIAVRLPEAPEVA
ncbi:protein phosphatase 2C domain-containing protein [Gemmata sp. JC673]|uniref:Protein phosphatase 2C domain-containing protein n=1 Tax=Gemmata algarum TaxID=2975278 RepID=A0ABU5EZM5_9BACT|nr:hypothetical protein [Gemmata algarum]MDY3560766.1 protein phosphatase 2C domain-containing protein [Gemmata algarum]